MNRTEERGLLVKVSPENEKIANSQGKETILVVDDQDSVRENVCAILEKTGYKVCNARNITEALEVINRDCYKNIDLLLVDIKMLEINGCDLFKKMIRNTSGFKILYMYGAANHGIDFFSECSIPIIKKPFSVKSLISEVNNVLTG